MSLGHGDLPIADGAIRLAQMTNARLILVFGVRTEEMSYSIHIEKPISADGGDTLPALRQYADVLHQYIERYPYQCRGLSNFSARDDTT